MAALIDAAGGAAPRWYAHRLNRPTVYRAGALLARVLPRPARLALAGALARRAASWFPTERKHVAANLARVRPQASEAERGALVDDVFRHFAVCFADLVSTNRRRQRPDRLVAHIEGDEHLLAAAATGGGLVLLTAHLGNWELGGRLLAARLGRPTHVVVAAEADLRVEHFLRGGPSPVRFVRLGDPTVMLSLVPALRRGELVALQGDRALGTRGDTRVDFLGAPAPFPRGPFVLARAAGVPIVPAFCLLDAGRRYRVVMAAPIHVGPDGDGAALGQWVAVLERLVRRAPEQWFNFYDVWSTAPAS
ncbi:MAG TPA: lysophospholipid acyltransferase family protein [Methylomirabilota bacterium]|nr:lysophospholipid acyltransferase family protein [Methylomirabilota bacterium]